MPDTGSQIPDPSTHPMLGCCFFIWYPGGWVGGLASVGRSVAVQRFGRELSELAPIIRSELPHVPETEVIGDVGDPRGGRVGSEKTANALQPVGLDVPFRSDIEAFHECILQGAFTDSGGLAQRCHRHGFGFVGPEVLDGTADYEGAAATGLSGPVRKRSDGESRDPA